MDTDTNETVQEATAETTEQSTPVVEAVTKTKYEQCYDAYVAYVAQIGVMPAVLEERKPHADHLIALFMSDFQCTKNGATTYFHKCRKQHGTQAAA